MASAYRKHLRRRRRETSLEEGIDHRDSHLAVAIAVCRGNRWVGARREKLLNLPGGVLLTKRTNSDVWSYPNIYGDITAIADGNGVK